MAAMERKLRCGGRSTMMLCLWWLMGGAFANVVTREHPEEPKIDKLNGRPNIDANELIGGHPYAEEFRRSAGYVKESHPPYGNNGYGGSPPPPPYGNRPMCEFNGPYPEPYHHQEHHGHYYGGHKSNGYNDNYGYVKQKNYGLPGYGHHKKHSTYGGDNSYSNNHHHLSNYEYGGGGGAHYGNNYGGENGGYGNEGGYDYHHHNSDTNVYDVVGKSKETVEDVYDQKALKHNHYQVDRSDLIYPLHIPHSKSSYESDYGGSSPTASYDQPYAYSGQGVYGGDMYQKPSPYSDNAYSGAPNAGDYTGSPVRTSLLTPQGGEPLAADPYRRPISISTTAGDEKRASDEASTSATSKPPTTADGAVTVPHRNHWNVKNEKDLLILHEKILGGTTTTISSSTQSSVTHEETTLEAGRLLENAKEGTSTVAAASEPVELTTSADEKPTPDVTEHADEDSFPSATVSSNFNVSDFIVRLRNNIFSAKRTVDEKQQAHLGEELFPSDSAKADKQEEWAEATNSDELTIGSSGEEATAKPSLASNKAPEDQKPVEADEKISSENSAMLSEASKNRDLSEEHEQSTSETSTALKNSTEDASLEQFMTPAKESMNPREVKEEATTESFMKNDTLDEQPTTGPLTTLRDASEKEDEEMISNFSTVSSEIWNPVKETEPKAEIPGAFATDSLSLTEDGSSIEEEKSSSTIPVEAAEENISKSEVPEIVEKSTTNESSTEALEWTSEVVKIDESVTTKTMESEETTVEQRTAEALPVHADEDARSAVEASNVGAVKVSGATPATPVTSASSMRKRNVTAAMFSRLDKRKPFEPEPMAGANFARR